MTARPTLPSYKPAFLLRARSVPPGAAGIIVTCHPDRVTSESTPSALVPAPLWPRARYERFALVLPLKLALE